MNPRIRLWLALALLSVLSASSVSAQQKPRWDTYSDTWVGRDALGRALPTSAEAGPPRPNKTVGMFYFLTFERGGDGPYDNTQILKASPGAMADIHDPAWGPLNTSHYWGEPLFGYYPSDDESVLRKHAQMLVDAGVDVVIFDNSNAVTYDRARNTLCRVWEDIRRHGGRTPQIAFLCPFGNPGHIGTHTVRELYDTLYKPGLYRDLWFLWRGKPLIMADPSYADPTGLSDMPRQPAELRIGSTLGQTFTATRPFKAAGGEFPTWATTNSGMTLSLYAGGPGGRLLARRTYQNVKDNATVLLDAGRTLPPGAYYLEMSRPVGHIGWWSNIGDVYAGGQGFEGRTADGSDRSLWVQDADATRPRLVSPDGEPMSPQAAERLADTLRNFFTFRSPIAPYNIQSPPPDHWAWLQVAPQAPQRDDQGSVEQVTVGVAQNYNATVNNTAPMSVPGAFGRSYHQGRLDTRPDAVNWGFNFGEQWDRARQIDPPFVFITGWNEWTAGFYDSWVRWHAPPPIFVDEFTQEYSRDIEPMRGGHGDDYYYQLVANVRRYKGVRPLPLVTPARITMNSPFTAWRQVGPEFRDDIGDPVHRNTPGVGRSGPYVNKTGRNDIVAAKVSYDKQNIYFYARAARNLTAHTGQNWMLLYLNMDGDYRTGWMGYDYVLNRNVGAEMTSLERNVGGQHRWSSVGQVRFRAVGKELVIAVPRKMLGLVKLPSHIDFKWADNCYLKGDWTDFTLNGDAAPNDRFNYRAKFSAAH